MVIWIDGRLEGHTAYPTEVGIAAPTGHFVASIFLFSKDAALRALLAVFLDPILGKCFVHRELQRAFPVPFLHFSLRRWS